MQPSRRSFLTSSAALAVAAAPLPAVTQSDPLPSWDDGAAKRAIRDLVTRVTGEGGPAGGRGLDAQGLVHRLPSGPMSGHRLRSAAECLP